MTEDPYIILKGLLCCSRTNPDCDNCPFMETEIHCRELDYDASELIKALLAKIEEQEGLIDKLGQDIDNKLEYIYSLEERLGIMNE